MPSPSSQSNQIPTGRQQASTPWGDFNRLQFMVNQEIRKLQTSTLVEVVAVNNTGALAPVGFVDVRPLVNQVDAVGNPVPHVTIHNLPYLRIQGGANAIVIDPEVGDIGVALFASRDITKVKATRKAGNPGSLRQYSFSDGMYLGGMLNGTPSQYVQFNASGIKIHSPLKVTLDAPDVVINASTVEINASTSTTVTTPTFTVNGATVLNGTVAQTGGGASSFTGTISTSGDVLAQGISLHGHHHNDPQGGQVGPPT